MDQSKPATAAEPTGAPADEGRREALRKFGRYAAAAGPAAVLLLGARKGLAGNQIDGYDNNGPISNFNG